MKPYLFNYSDEVEMVAVNPNQQLCESTLQTFTIENNDNVNYQDGTMLTENLENTDTDFLLTGSTMVTNVIEHSDQDTLSLGTS